MTEHYTVHCGNITRPSIRTSNVLHPINTSMGSYNNDSIKRNITTEINSKVLLKQVYLNCTHLHAQVQISHTGKVVDSSVCIWRERKDLVSRTCAGDNTMAQRTTLKKCSQAFIPIQTTDNNASMCCHSKMLLLKDQTENFLNDYAKVSSLRRGGEEGKKLLILPQVSQKRTYTFCQDLTAQGCHEEGFKQNNF